MNAKRIEWLNQNRYRAYPFINDEGILCSGSRIPDCILLDCLVVDTRSGSGPRSLTVTKYTVSEDATVIDFDYDGSDHSVKILPSTSESEYEKLSGHATFNEQEGSFVEITLVCSKHEYILEHAGTGTWEFSGHVLPTKVVSVASTGVMEISANGSDQVCEAATASGDITLEDGYRTSPVVRNGRVLVRVGTAYGKDPCNYERPSGTKTECGNLLFFFCGQNAINGGNVVLKGGPGVNVSRGTYKAVQDVVDTYGKVGISAGESVPCISIKATTELLGIYRPSGD